jgi:glycosyltransferase involved in cell wall biosynthesis
METGIDMSIRDENSNARKAATDAAFRKAPDRLRVLYSFPHRLGTGRISFTASQQVAGISNAGADVTVFASSLKPPFPGDLNVKVRQTLALGKSGKLRLPFKLVGSLRAFALHDAMVARRLRSLAGQIDIVHTWPLGAVRTLKVARELGIPTVLERPNANTRFAYEVVQRECERLGVALPYRHEHAYNPEVLRIEEEEYDLADALLCPSDFVVKTFRDQGFESSKLVRHLYGFDEKAYYPDRRSRQPEPGLRMLFVGVCAVRKGVHFALDAWLRSPAHERGTFQIAGEFLPAYAEKLRPMLSHPSVKVLGHRNDIPDLMRQSDILVLPSIEEGFGLVIADAMGAGCVPLASNACTEICRHMETGLVHNVGDVGALTQHITMLHEDRDLLNRLREASLQSAPEFTWTLAGVKLLQAYRQTLEMNKKASSAAFVVSRSKNKEIPIVSRANARG